MYIKKIAIKNLGPISELNITPRFNDQGDSIPIILVGQNGAGKSLTLATILDAMTESRKKHFRELEEVGETEYIRVSSKKYIRKNSGFSYVYAEISNSLAELKFHEVVSRLPNEDFKQIAGQINDIPNLYNEEFSRSGFYKNAVTSGAYQEELSKLSFLYFPYFRYEAAYWMNKKANINLLKEDNFYGQPKINTIRTNIINETQRWILNIILDREVHEKSIGDLQLSNGLTVRQFQGYHGPNTQLLNMINEILTAMFKAKDKNIEYARVGIGRKGNREITVILKNKNSNDEEIVAPELSQLSSGELMTLGLATEIIRAYELVSGNTPEKLNEITGIVLIDEVDLHLHVNFQKAVLPLIIREFPKVQFIITTHSPLFLLGMDESGDVDIFNLPLGNKISAEDFTEFKQSHEIFLNNNKKFQERYNELKCELEKDSRPLIITEGKTDWQHIKLALETLRALGEFKDLHIEFLEFDSNVDMGDIKLSQMCEYMADLPQQRKLIFIFDRDNPKIIKKMTQDEKCYKFWGNKVYSVCLPTPPHRVGYSNLSIELYYKDVDLRTEEPESRKRLWFTNEIEIITLPTNGEKTYRTLKEPNQNHECDKKVFDQPADKITNSNGQYVGLSKSAFVEKIVKREEISESFERSAFRLLFHVIAEICEI
ncbi:hypothetical protein GU3_00435 [Oceanimonas sp. GK1]|uniref:AAA family ATPase n=1 Tax=Oceanimonas sp. (strain GK1 / IBRC-M 10197) TaxID=511062 RepID=UPI0002494BBD|nr:AAA family ATPase [Oceanimonas sp. GK1]AEX99843.1 hypothetical protein GU3_00435 [Oceanimonas sp. GK1]